MESAKERPEEHEPIGGPVEEPSGLEGVVAKAGPTRCAGCAQEVALEPGDWLACRGCLARHHAPCWEARAACAACGGGEALAPEHVPAPPLARGGRTARRVAVLGLLPLLLLVLVLLGGLRRGGAASTFAGDGRYADAIRAAGTLSSGDQADALVLLLDKPLTQGERLAVLALAEQMSSSTDRARVLDKVIAATSPLDDETAQAVVSAAAGMYSSADRDVVLADLVRAGISSATRQELLAVLSRASGGGDVLEVLARTSGLTETDQLKLIDAALLLTNTTDQADVLVALVEKGELTPAARKRLSERLNGIWSSSDRKRVVDALIESGD